MHPNNYCSCKKRKVGRDCYGSERHRLHWKDSWEDKKRWQDVSRATKEKETKRKNELRLTGGGEAPPDRTDVDDKVLSVIGPVAVHGVEGGIDTMEDDNISQTNSNVTQESLETQMEDSKDEQSQDDSDEDADEACCSTSYECSVNVYGPVEKLSQVQYHQGKLL